MPAQVEPIGGAALDVEDEGAGAPPLVRFRWPEPARAQKLAATRLVHLSRDLPSHQSSSFILPISSPVWVEAISGCLWLRSTMPRQERPRPGSGRRIAISSPYTELDGCQVWRRRPPADGMSPREKRREATAANQRIRVFCGTIGHRFKLKEGRTGSDHSVTGTEKVWWPSTPCIVRAAVSRSLLSCRECTAPVEAADGPASRLPAADGETYNP